MLSCVFSEIKELLLTRYEARMITSYTQKLKFMTPRIENILYKSPNLNYFGKMHHHVTVSNTHVFILGVLCEMNNKLCKIKVHV